MQRSSQNGDETDHQLSNSVPGGSTGKSRRTSSRTEMADVDDKAASMIGRTFSETEKNQIGDVISNIVQEVSIPRTLLAWSTQS